MSVRCSVQCVLLYSHASTGTCILFRKTIKSLVNVFKLRFSLSPARFYLQTSRGFLVNVLLHIGTMSHSIQKHNGM